MLAGGVFGVFVSLDLFMLFFFYEIAVFPMYLLIAIWGWVKTREYAAMKLTLYLFIGSVVSLVGALAMYWQAGQNTGIYTFDMLQMEKAGFSPHSNMSGSCRSSSALQCWAASGPSTTGRLMVTWPRRQPSPCSMQAC